MSEIERVRYGIDAVNGDIAGTDRQSEGWTVTRSDKTGGHWGPARHIGAPLTYDAAVAEYCRLVEANRRAEHGE